MGRMEPNHRVAQRIADEFNKMDVDPVKVAGVLTMGGKLLQVRLYHFVMKLIYNWALAYDYNDYNGTDDYSNVVIKSKRLVEFMEHTGEP